MKRDKQGKFVKGHKHTEETKRQMSLSKQGNKNPMYGIGKQHSFYGKKLSEEHKQKIRKSKQKKPYTHTEKRKEKIRQYQKGRKRTKEHGENISKALMGHKGYWKGKFGKDSFNWNGGSSFEGYPTTWTNDVKEAIRKRDNYLCQVCFKSQEEEGNKLAVHHIDYNKNNVNENNLISLCHSCHLKTNYNRKYWVSYLRNREVYKYEV